MVALTKAVDSAGCTLVGLTGRNDDQKAATLGNLAKVGYTGFTAAELLHEVDREGRQHANPATSPVPPRSARPSSTSRRPASTSPHRGTRIVANLGDQFSDLIGGYGDRQVKLPNPTYYLP